LTAVTIGKRDSCTLSIAAALLMATVVPSSADGEMAVGAALASDYCAACHRVTVGQPAPPPVMMKESTSEEAIPAPSFRDIAQRPGRDAGYLRGFIEAPHFPMPEQLFIPEELDAIIAYITSLKDDAGSW
jgi:mono/diheme cytochrome c family protein